MELRPFGGTGLDVSAIGFGCWEVGRRLRRRRRGRVRARRRAGARPRHQLLRHRRGLRHGRVRAGARPGPGPAPGRGDHRHQVRDELPGQAQPARQQPGAGPRVDRQEPEEPRHRLRRRVPRALARSRDSVRGDDAGPRRDRPRRQGPLRRPLELQARGDRGLHGSAFRVDVVQYGWNMFDRRMQREILPYCQEHGIGFMAYGSLALRPAHGHVHRGPRTSAAADWRSRQGNMGSIKMFEALFGAETFPRQRAGGRRAEGDRRPLRQEPPAARAAVGDLAPGGQHRARRVAGTSPRWRTTWARSGGRSATPTSPRSTGSSTVTASTPPPSSGSKRPEGPRDGRGAGGEGRRSSPAARAASAGRSSSASPRQARPVVIADVTRSGARRWRRSSATRPRSRPTDVADADQLQARGRLRGRALRRAPRDVQQRRHRRARAAASSTTTSATSSA